MKSSYKSKKSRQNWHHLNCPKDIRQGIIKFVKNQKQIPIQYHDTHKFDKQFNFSKVKFSCKKTENRVFYRILFHWRSCFLCIDMNQKTFYLRQIQKEVFYNRLEDAWINDKCPNCEYRSDWIYNGWDEVYETWLVYDNHVTSTLIKGDIRQTAMYNNIHKKCYTYIDRFRSSIPIRKVTRLNTISDNILETYFY